MNEFPPPPERIIRKKFKLNCNVVCSNLSFPTCCVMGILIFFFSPVFPHKLHYSNSPILPPGRKIIYQCVCLYLAARLFATARQWRPFVFNMSTVRCGWNKPMSNWQKERGLGGLVEYKRTQRNEWTKLRCFD